MNYTTAALTNNMQHEHDQVISTSKNLTTNKGGLLLSYDKVNMLKC